MPIDEQKMDWSSDAEWHLAATEWLKGGVIGNAEVARRFAELVLEFTQGPEMLQQQSPLTVEDRGDTWFIQGSWNRNKTEPGSGPFEMIVRKKDAQVLDLGITAVLSQELIAQVRDLASIKKQDKS